MSRTTTKKDVESIDLTSLAESVKAKIETITPGKTGTKVLKTSNPRITFLQNKEGRLMLKYSPGGNPLNGCIISMESIEHIKNDIASLERGAKVVSIISPRNTAPTGEVFQI